MKAHRRAPLVIVVGRDSPIRRAVGHELIERGYPVVMCSGPPGCVLTHEESCVLLERVDIAVLLPRLTGMERSLLAGCARRARHVIFVYEPEFDPPPGSVVVGTASAATIARAADALARAGPREGQPSP